MDENVQLERFEALGKEVGRRHRISKIHLAENTDNCNPFELYNRQVLEAEINGKQGFLRTALEQILSKIDVFEKQAQNEAKYVADIGIHLYAAVSSIGDDLFKEREATANTFMKYFMCGYFSENKLDAVYLKEIALFLKLEEWRAHAALYSSLDLNQMTQWQCDYFEQTKTRILHEIPIVAYRKEWISGVDVLHTPVVTVKLQPNFALLFVS